MTLVIGLFFIMPAAFATSGACSGHGGVDCSAGPDSDGSVICYDGWEDSSVSYSSMVMCQGYTTPEPSPTPMPSPSPTIYPSAPENSFSDTSTYSYRDAIEFVKSEGIVSGYEDGTYKPINKINRAEFTKILIQTAFPDELSTFVPTACFKDVPADAWFAKYVCLAKNKGVIGGYPDGTFGPDKNINVAESLKITLEALFPNIPSAEGEWYQKYLNYADGQGYTVKEWSSVTTQITRGEMAEFIYRIKK